MKNPYKELENQLEVIKSYLDMMQFKYETSYYGYDKCHLNFIADTIEFQVELIKIMGKMLERTSNTKKSK